MLTSQNWGSDYIKWSMQNTQYNAGDMIHTQ